MLPISFGAIPSVLNGLVQMANRAKRNVLRGGLISEITTEHTKALVSSPFTVTQLTRMAAVLTTIFLDHMETETFLSHVVDDHAESEHPQRFQQHHRAVVHKKSSLFSKHL